MMLPQFGFIVAQAGADSHTLPNNTTATTTNNHHSSSLAPLLTNHKSNPSLPFKLPQTFYSPQSSSASNNSLLPPLLPPPYMYANNKIDPWYSPVPRYVPQPLPQQQEEEEEEELFDRWQGQYNDLITWMDNEFWEQADEIYQEKVTNLQEELKRLQKGTHSAYQEITNDIELDRENRILDAEYLMKYQLSFIEQYFDRDVMAVEEEYESEKRQIEENLIASLEDRRKQLKEDQEQEGTKAVKRNLRKRNHDAVNVSNQLIKEHTPKKRAVRPSTLPNIYSLSATQEEELENDFLNMKKPVYTF